MIETRIPAMTTMKMTKTVVKISTAMGLGALDLHLLCVDAWPGLKFEGMLAIRPSQTQGLTRAPILGMEGETDDRYQAVA
jgi:hypothetical protein